MVTPNKLKQLFSDEASVISREFLYLGKTATVLCLDTVSSKDNINLFIVKPMLDAQAKPAASQGTANSGKGSGKGERGKQGSGESGKGQNSESSSIMEHLKNSVILQTELALESDLQELKKALLMGDAVLFVEGEPDALVVDNKEWAVRGIAEPPTAAVLKGPREGFNENLKDNISLIRRKIKSEKLVVERAVVGRYTNTNVAVMYIDGIADKQIVKDVMRRINEMDIDGILDSAYITKYLETSRYSLFKQVGNTEKPDVAAGKMLEGRICIFVDGSPIALTVPFIMLEDLQSPSDYFTKNSRATMIRGLRILAVFMALYLPAIYVSLVEHHTHVIKFRFLLTIMNASANLPLSPKHEILVVVLFFEILHESALRMPRHIGMAVSVVGALVLGETAVRAGMLSTPAVMIAALSGIALYNVPDAEGTFSTIRILFVIIAGALGFYGLIIGSMMLLVYLATFESYSVPYLAPFSPMVLHDMKDAVLKSNPDELTERPYSIPTKNRQRVAP
ncbi:MAG: spore germination protein [Firmicutes bacterium]|nr:spore germination protein [Bacillota bacterium]